MGVSIREYARQRDVSDTVVRKTLKQGRITAEADVTIDVERTDREWSANTANPQTNRVRLKQLKGELIDRNEAIAHVFRLARQKHDARQTWPAMISGQMTAELETNAHQLHVTLERYVREHLEEL